MVVCVVVVTDDGGAVGGGGAGLHPCWLGSWEHDTGSVVLGLDVGGGFVIHGCAASHPVGVVTGGTGTDGTGGTVLLPCPCWGGSEGLFRTFWLSCLPPVVGVQSCEQTVVVVDPQFSVHGGGVHGTGVSS